MLRQLLDWLVDWLTGQAVKQDRAEREAANAAADVIVIQKANEAARQVEEGGDEPDPNDRDNR